MRRTQSKQLKDISPAALRIAGASEADTLVVAGHLVDNSVIGHHAHGMIRVREYADTIDRGELIPSARPRIVAEKAARSDMASIIFTCKRGHGINQPPFGGAEPKLSSNPIAMSFPSTLDGPQVMDMATSVVAEGKARMYRAAASKPHPGGSLSRTETRP